MIEILIISYVIGGLCMGGFFLRNTWGEWQYGLFGWAGFLLVMLALWPLVLLAMVASTIDGKLDRRRLLKCGWVEVHTPQGTYLSAPEDKNGD